MSSIRPHAPQAHLLIEQHGSPLYVYDTRELCRCYTRFVAAFQHPRTECHYAIVCNKNPALVAELLELGAGVHANTPGDAFAALQAGATAEQIVYSGTNLTDDDIELLTAAGIHLNLDSLDQLERFARIAPGGDVGLRMLMEDTAGRSRIGLTPAELPEALVVARRAGVSVTGVHMYAGTHTRSHDRFVACLERTIDAAVQLPDLEFIDLGGGFGVAYRRNQDALDLAVLGAEVDRRMAALEHRVGRPLRLLLEPGRILVATCGTLLVRVVSVKQRGGRRFVGVDSSVAHFVVPSVYGAFHRVEVMNPRSQPLEVPTDLCGNTTHSQDFLGRSLRLPELRPGDVIAIRDVGAYGYAMSSHFLNRPRPAEVVLDDAGVPSLTTRREQLEDLTALTSGSAA